MVGIEVEKGYRQNSGHGTGTDEDSGLCFSIPRIGHKRPLCVQISTVVLDEYRGFL